MYKEISRPMYDSQEGLYFKEEETQISIMDIYHEVVKLNCHKFVFE